MSTRFRTLFTAKLAELCDKKEICSSYLTGVEYRTIIERLTDLHNNPQMRKVAKDYRILRRYEVAFVTSEDDTIVPKLIKPNTQLYFVSNDELFDAITEIHGATNHGGRDAMYGKAKKKYVNITKEVRPGCFTYFFPAFPYPDSLFIAFAQYFSAKSMTSPFSNSRYSFCTPTSANIVTFNEHQENGRQWRGYQCQAF